MGSMFGGLREATGEWAKEKAAKKSSVLEQLRAMKIMDEMGIQRFGQGSTPQVQGLRPKTFNRFGQPISYENPEILTPGQRTLKDKATQKIFETVEMNQAKKTSLDKALEGSGTIPQGWWGKQRVNMAKSWPVTRGLFGVNDKTIQDAQEMKIALTMGTLAETAYTKGAISDQEMNLFKDAAANNDFNSPAVFPVLEKIRRYLDAEESGLMGAYKQNYGEDPKGWFESQQTERGAPKSEMRFGSGGGMAPAGGVPEWAAGEEEFYSLAKQKGFTDEQIRAKLGR